MHKKSSGHHAGHHSSGGHHHTSRHGHSSSHTKATHHYSGHAHRATHGHHKHTTSHHKAHSTPEHIAHVEPAPIPLAIRLLADHRFDRHPTEDTSSDRAAWEQAVYYYPLPVPGLAPYPIADLLRVALIEEALVARQVTLDKEHPVADELLQRRANDEANAILRQFENAKLRENQELPHYSQDDEPSRWREMAEHKKFLPEARQLLVQKLACLFPEGRHETAVAAVTQYEATLDIFLGRSPSSERTL